MNYVVLDLEMCRISKALMSKDYKWSRETIQIGAILLDDDYNVVKKFSTFVRPEYGRLDPFIINLTGITKENVYTAPTYREAMEKFLRWLPEGEVSLVAWSRADRQQIEKESELKGLDEAVMNRLMGAWIDCQELFDEKMNVSYQYSLEEALIASDICTEGRAHDGLVDAYNTALLFAKLRKDPEFELNRIYSDARSGKVEHLGVTLGDMFRGMQLQWAV
ncbi:MAG: exonuclease domain-containing protein [Lachnospiraceae bacterium]|nr:exonuclease domain-containing protein [Lachnospiraceae bacterium]